MSKEQDYKIWMWKYLKPKFVPTAAKRYRDAKDNHAQAPNFTTCDQEAMALLPILVKKGYYPALCYHEIGEYVGKWVVKIAEIVTAEKTIASAICVAVLELIEKEEA